MTDPIADRRRVEAAMVMWRKQIAQDGYAGLKRPDVAYSLASVIDMLALRWREQDDRTRSVVLGFVEQVERADQATD